MQPPAAAEITAVSARPAQNAATADAAPPQNARLSSQNSPPVAWAAAPSAENVGASSPPDGVPGGMRNEPTYLSLGLFVAALFTWPSEAPSAPLLGGVVFICIALLVLDLTGANRKLALPAVCYRPMLGYVSGIAFVVLALFVINGSAGWWLMAASAGILAHDAFTRPAAPYVPTQTATTAQAPAPDDLLRRARRLVAIGGVLCFLTLWGQWDGEARVAGAHDHGNYRTYTTWTYSGSNAFAVNRATIPVLALGALGAWLLMAGAPLSSDARVPFGLAAVLIGYSVKVMMDMSRDVDEVVRMHQYKGMGAGPYEMIFFSLLIVYGAWRLRAARAQA